MVHIIKSRLQGPGTGARKPTVAHRTPLHTIVLGASALMFWATVSGCASRDAGADALPQVRMEIEHLATLDRAAGPILASANSIARGSDGRIYIGDSRDQVIKVFGPDGVQQEPVGKSGPGPGEFATLLSAGLLGDSLYGWDMRTNRLSIFNRAGEFVRAIPLRQPSSPMLSRIRVMDDSLLVASGWVLGAHDRPLVQVFDRDGHRLGQLMNLDKLLSPPDPELVQHTWAFADGSDGIVFSTIQGVDTILAFDALGRPLGAGRIGLAGREPVLNLPALIKANGGSLRRPDGSWAQHGHYGALKVVALGDGLAAVQFGLLEAGGTDPLSAGGPIVLLQLQTDGVIRHVGQIDAPGALLGRTAPGEALILRWSGDSLEDLELLRLTTTPN